MKVSNRVFWLLFIGIVGFISCIFVFNGTQETTVKAATITIFIMVWLIGDIIIRKGKRVPK